MWRSKTFILGTFLVLISAVGYLLVGYYSTQDNFLLNFSLYSIVFGAFLGLYALRESFSNTTLWSLTIFMHALLLFSLPSLSPDVYRFLWDGELVTQGIHPYAATPNQLVNSELVTMTHYMGQLYTSITDLSKANYSVYPSVNQLYFIIPAWFTENAYSGIVVMRILMLLTVLIGIRFIQKTLLVLRIPEKRVFLFALNPLLIIEATGNLHFEGVMFSFLAMALYFLVQQKWWISALFLALAINVKLTPLLLLPFFLNFLGWRKSVGFSLLTLSFSALLLAVFLWPSLAANFMQSIELYFNNFEFNSSLNRWSIYLFQPILTYDTVLIIGPLLSKIALLVIVFLALFSLKKEKETLYKFLLLGYVVYLLFATTVHPWYIIIPLGLSVFTSYNYVVYWSFVVMVSYSFYAFGESRWVDTMIAIEYLGLFIWIIVAHKKKRTIKSPLF